MSIETSPGGPDNDSVLPVTNRTVRLIIGIVVAALTLSLALAAFRYDLWREFIVSEGLLLAAALFCLRLLRFSRK